MIVLILLIFSVFLFAVSQKLKKNTYEKKYRLLKRLKDEGFVEVDEGYPVLYLSMDTTSFEEIVRIVGENTCRPMIIILESPIWYASLKKAMDTSYCNPSNKGIINEASDISFYIKNRNLNF